MTTRVASSATIAVLSSRPLWGDAVACALASRSLTVLSGPVAFDADVLVLVDPGDAQWAPVRELGRPAVVLIAGEPSADELFELVEAGAHAVLAKGCEPAALVGAVESIAAGGTGLTGRQVRLLAEGIQARGRPAGCDVSSITKREREILAAIEAGLSVKQTARLLEISPRTVESTQRHLFRKLGVRNRSQAVARALEAGVLGSHAAARPGGRES